MKLALECPTRMLNMVQPFADFDFLLAHKVLKEADYLEYYKKSSNVQILDNSVNELGQPMTTEEIKQAYEALENPRAFVVAPDFIGNVTKTLEAFKTFAEAFPLDRIIPVVQGKDLIEAIACTQLYINIYNENKVNLRLSIPYDIGSLKTDPVTVMAVRRALFINAAVPETVSVHLLGFTCIDEFTWYHHKKNVETIDTGAPILLGLQEADILEPIKDKSQPTLNLMEGLEMKPKTWAAICRNLALMRKYMP